MDFEIQYAVLENALCRFNNRPFIAEFASSIREMANSPGWFGACQAITQSLEFSNNTYYREIFYAIATTTIRCRVSMYGFFDIAHEDWSRLSEEQQHSIRVSRLNALADAIDKYLGEH